MLAVAFILLVPKLIHKPMPVDRTISWLYETMFFAIKVVPCGSEETLMVDNDSVRQNPPEIICLIKVI